MSQAALTFPILIVHEDSRIKEEIHRIFSALESFHLNLTAFKKYSRAVKESLGQDYRLILLDDRVTYKPSAKFSIPAFRTAYPSVPIAIISNKAASGRAEAASDFGVDHMVASSDLLGFITSLIGRLRNEEDENATAPFQSPGQRWGQAL